MKRTLNFTQVESYTLVVKPKRTSNGLLRLLYLICFLCCGLAAEAADAVKVGSIYYEFNNNDNTAKVVGKESDKYSGDVNIPGTVSYSGRYYTVTEIYSAFTSWNVNGLTSVTIPNTVTTIGTMAFHGANMTTLTIPENVKSIGESSLYYACKTLNFNAKNCQVHDNAFKYGGVEDNSHISMETLVIGSNVETIPNGGFRICNRLTTINVANDNSRYKSVDGILFDKSGSKLIKYPAKKDGTSYTIPEGVTEIDYYAFSSCSGLTEVTIPVNVTSIGRYAFVDCSGLTKITLPYVMNNSFYYIFGKSYYYTYNNYGINYDIPASLRTVVIAGGSSIPNNAFSDLSTLTSITLAESVTSIGNSAFSGCSGLTSINIPQSVTSIGGAAFYKCNKLTSVTFERVTPPTFGTEIFYNTNNCPIYVPTPEAATAYRAAGNMSDYASRVKCVKIVDGIKYEIETTGAKVLADIYSGNIVIPESISLNGNTYPVISIDNSAFKNRTSLSSVTFESATPPTFGTNVFDNTNNCLIFVPTLDAVTAYKNANNMSGYASRIMCGAEIGGIMYGLNSTSATVMASNYSGDIVIPESISLNGNTYSVTSVNNSAFKDCTGLTSVTFESATPPTFGTNVFDNTNNCPIYVPSSAAVTAYSAAANMSGYASRIMIIKIEIGGIKYGIEGTEAIVLANSYSGDIVIPKSITFNGNTYPVTSIDGAAFKNCTGLTSVTIPEGVTSIDNSAFYNCSGLTSVTIPESVTSIGGYAFYSCTNLKTVNFNATNCTSMYNNGNLVFGRCSLLRNLNIGDNVKTIPDYAFCDCEPSTITIPEGVTSIGACAFECRSAYNSNLTSVTIPNSVTSIGAAAFKGCNRLTKITLPFVGDKPHTATDSYQYPFGYIFGTSSYTNGTKTQQLYVQSSTGSTSYSYYYIPATLRTVVITGSSYIQPYAFYGCSGLTSITLPESVTSVGNSAFYNCSGLSSVTFKGETPPTFGTQVFYSTNNCPIYVASPEYKNATNMSSYASRIKCVNVIDGIKYEVETTEAKVLANNYSGNIVIPESITLNGNTYPVTSIDGSAFKSRTDLASVTIPESVTSIGKEAFYNCTKLTSVTFEGATPPTFGTQVFYNSNNCPIYVPTSAAATKYKAASNMSSYAGRVVSLTKAITVKANNSFGTVSGGGDYMPNATATITAEPAENCIFVRWSDDGEGYTNATREVMVTEDKTYTAQFKRVLTVSATANSRSYNGTATATGAIELVGVAEGDNVTLSYTAATFVDKHAGTGKTVIFSGITLGGTNAGNYTLNDVTTATATADITPKTITVTATANSRKYDRSIDASGSLSSADIVSDDNVTFSYATAKFENKNVGTNKVVTFSGITIGGTDAANYTLSSTTATANADITVKGLTLSDFVASEKTFDGTTNATGGSFSDDRVSGDALEFSFDYAFDNMNAADAVTVNFRNIAISGGNDKDNYTLLTTSGTGSAKILSVTDEVVLNFTMPTRTVMYNGLANRYEMPTADELFSTNNELYRTYGGFQPADNDAFQAARASVFAQTEVGEYTFGYNSETLVNTSTNFTNVKFNVTDGKLIITPNTNVVVTITENSGELSYNTEEQSVSGYAVTNIEDETGKFAETDITFNGNAVAAGTTVGTYPMELSAADFSHKNTNFANVTFNIVDGALTITKAAEAPNKPETEMSTLFVNTQLIELPTDWAWTEFKALELGSNTATANYTGADAGNYELESVDIAITRGPCEHHGDTTMLYVATPTCTLAGFEGNLSCALCGEIYEMGDSIPALGHDFVNTVIAPTCTVEGYTKHLCNRCNHVEYSDTVAATGHKADSVLFENIMSSTCTEAGSYDSVVYCSVCKAEVSRTKIDTPANGHKADSVLFENIMSSTCTEAGSYDSVVYCSVCKAEVSRTKIETPANGHKADSVVIENIVVATHTATGSYDSVVYCSVCHAEVSRKTIEVAMTDIISVVVSKMPNKLTYKVGEKLDVAGGKLKVIFSDSTSIEVDMLAIMVSGFEAEVAGKQTLTITYTDGGKTYTATFDIEVENNSAVAEDAAANVNIYAFQNTIVVEAEADGSEIFVFDINGRMVAKALATGSRTEIQMPKQGVYIVRIGNKAERVAVN